MKKIFHFKSFFQKKFSFSKKSGFQYQNILSELFKKHHFRSICLTVSLQEHLQNTHSTFGHPVSYQYLCHSFVNPCFINHPFLVNNSGELFTKSNPQPSGVPRLSEGEGLKLSVDEILSFLLSWLWLLFRLCKAANPGVEIKLYKLWST